MTICPVCQQWTREPHPHGNWPGYTDVVVDLDATPDDFSVTIDGEEVEL